MKTASHIARILLGLIFTVFGLNGFLHFIPLPLPSDVAGQFTRMIHHESCRDYRTQVCT